VSWVYIIGAVGGSTVKIGRGHPIRRLHGIQVGNPEELQVLARQRVSLDDAKRIEARIHAGLGAFRLRGEWFRRSEEVDLFLNLFRRARRHHLEIYLARLLREMRCDRCRLPIRLDAPLHEVGRCGDCVEAARRTGEQLRAARAAARERREAQRDARLPEMPEGERYLSLEGVARYTSSSAGAGFLRRAVQTGRLRAAYFRGSSGPWFLPEWVDDWMMSFASPPPVAAVDPHATDPGTPSTRD